MTMQFDSVIHPEQRMRICAFLAPNDEVAFSIVRETLDMSESALSRQVKILVEAGYVSVTKESGVPRPRSWMALTDEGRRAIKGHLQALQQLAADAER